MPGHKPPPPAAPADPPFYEAAADIYVGHPESGTMPVLAYSAGARVEPDVVAANGWEHLVKVPAMFAPAPPGPSATAGEES